MRFQKLFFILVAQALATSAYAGKSDLKCMAEIVRADADITDKTELVGLRLVPWNELNTPAKKLASANIIIPEASGDPIYKIDFKVEFAADASNWNDAQNLYDVIKVEARLVEEKAAQKQVLAVEQKKSDTVTTPYELGLIKDGKPQVLMKLNNPAIENLIANGLATSATDAVLKGLIGAKEVWETNLLCQIGLE